MTDQAPALLGVGTPPKPTDEELDRWALLNWSKVDAWFILKGEDAYALREQGSSAYSLGLRSVYGVEATMAMAHYLPPAEPVGEVTAEQLAQMIDPSTQGAPLSTSEPIMVCDPASYGHVGLILRDDAGIGHCSICGEEADPGIDEGMTAEVVVAGKSVSPFAPRPACEHDGFLVRTMFAVVRANADGTGRVVRREVKLTAKCRCGAPMRFLLDSVRPSSTEGDRGLVCTVEAVMDTEAVDGWQEATEE